MHRTVNCTFLVSFYPEIIKTVQATFWLQSPDGSQEVKSQPVYRVIRHHHTTQSVFKKGSLKDQHGTPAVLIRD